MLIEERGAMRTESQRCGSNGFLKLTTPMLAKSAFDNDAGTLELDVCSFFSRNRSNGFINLRVDLIGN